VRITLFVVALILLVVFSQVAGQEKPGPVLQPADSSETEDFDFWMNVKLLESQKLLEALAKSDFDTLAKSSQTLATLSAVEGFVRRRIPGYATQLRSFEFAVDEIKEQAMRENIEGVTLGFQQLTLSCVNCHKQVRVPTVEAE
jgi:cytochrome c556